MGERGVHPGRSCGKEPGPVQVCTDLSLPEPPHNRVQAEGSAPHSVDSGQIPEELAGILRIRLPDLAACKVNMGLEVGHEHRHLDPAELDGPHVQLEVDAGCTRRGNGQGSAGGPVPECMYLDRVLASRDFRNRVFSAGPRECALRGLVEVNRGVWYRVPRLALEHSSCHRRLPDGCCGARAEEDDRGEGPE